MESFGAFIRYIRKSKGLTQEQVAEKLNIVSPVLSKWENNKGMPSLDIMCKLCNIYELSIEECIEAQKIDSTQSLPPFEYDAGRLGENLKALRLKNNWSQSELGKQLFVTSQTVSKWESGKLASAETLVELAKLYGVSTAELLGTLNFSVNANTQIVSNNSDKRIGVASKKHKKIFAIVLSIVAIILIGCILGLSLGLKLNDVPTDSGNSNLPSGDIGSSNNNGPVQDNNPGDGDSSVDTNKNPSDDNNDTDIKPDNPNEPDVVDSEYEYPSKSREIIGGYKEILSNQELYSSFHEGIDFAAQIGDEIYAPFDGVINSTGRSVWEGSYIAIGYLNADIEARFEAVVLLDDLDVGNKVKKGQLIGYVADRIGEKCNQHKNHYFHYSILKDSIVWGGTGVSVDPRDYLPKTEHVIFDFPSLSRDVVGTYLDIYYSHSAKDFCLHNGIDFALSVGKEIHSAFDGTVLDIGLDEYAGQNYIDILYSEGRITARYASIDVLDDLKIGDEVKAGELIGYVSKIGGKICNNKKGKTFFHFAIYTCGDLKYWFSVNPLEYLSEFEPIEENTAIEEDTNIGDKPNEDKNDSSEENGDGSETGDNKYEENNNVDNEIDAIYNPDDANAYFVCPSQSREIAREFGDMYMNQALGEFVFHQGVDFIAIDGDFAYAIADGVIVDAGYNNFDSYYIKVSYYGGRVECRYLMVKAKDGLSKGDMVKRGQKIGVVESSQYNLICANTKNTYFHFEMKIDNTDVNPMEYLLDEKKMADVLGEKEIGVFDETGAQN